MGLSSRHRQGKKRLGGNHISEAKQGAPLRKIVQTLIRGESLFDVNSVVLECGHRASSNGISKARCADCKAGKPQCDPQVTVDAWIASFKKATSDE